MGYNATVIVMGDALDLIAKDPNFGKNMVDAILHLSVDPKPVDIVARIAGGAHLNAATAVQNHHGDVTSLVAVGGNWATVLGQTGMISHNKIEGQVELLKRIADQFGYRLVRKPEGRNV